MNFEFTKPISETAILTIKECLLASKPSIHRYFITNTHLIAPTMVMFQMD